MQANLRRAHRRVWPVLAAILVVGFVLGLVLRPERPIETRPVMGDAQPTESKS